MKIRTQLIALVTGVAIPLALLSSFVTYQLWSQQRRAYEEQFLERAGAVRLAIDTEFDVTLRTLRATGDATEIPPPEVETVLRRRFRRFLDNYPDWITVSLTDAKGQVVMVNTRPGAVAAPPLPLADIRRALASPSIYVSDVVNAGGGRHVVYVAAAVVPGSATQGVIIAAIDHTHWLEMLRGYPVSAQGTLTLLDQRGAVIARTVDDPLWAGKAAPASYVQRTSGRDSGAFKTAGMDARVYYAAFSRCKSTGWTLATGVPEGEVDQALQWKTFVSLVLSLLAVLGALLAAWHLGRRISQSMLGLLASASALAGKEPISPIFLPSLEARVVQDALVNEHEQLLARENELGVALQREAAEREKAERASQAKDQFLAMMGHELRNPLSAITAAMDLVGIDNVSRAALQRSRDIVRRQAAHLAVMINDLMDVAQLGSGEIVLHKKRIDLAQVAAKVLLRFDETGRCAHLQMRTVHVPAWIDGDEARVELLMTCLLDNACKYTPAGGTVLLEVIGEPDFSVLRISDTGIGIAADIAGSLFDAFTQGKRGIERTEGGLGLGLALVRELVGLHDGHISLRSEGAGHGATFTVRFPRAIPPGNGVLLAGSAMPVDALVTVVEDIADNREALVMLLEAQRFRVSAASDGPSGVDLILTGPSDVAVIDIGLPGFDGYEVARRVRRAAAGQHVILMALTGYGTENDRAKALAAGFDAFLVKPFDPVAFEAALRDGFAKKLGD